MSVEIYRRVNGQKLEKFIATMPGVQDTLQAHAVGYARTASRILSMHRAQGHSFIAVEHGKVDWHVVLNDERGLRAAAAIEYGRQENGGSAGVFALHQAFGLGMKGARLR